MNSVGVPRITPVASPLATSRAIRAATSSPVRSSSKRPRVEPDLAGVGPEVFVLERLLAMEEELVHLPEATLRRRRFGCRRGRERVRVDLRQREVTKGEADAAGELLLDALDRPEGLARVGALVVAVLEDDGGTRFPADVVHVIVEWLDDRSVVSDVHRVPLLSDPIRRGVR